MLSSHLHKFTTIYNNFGLGAVKNLCLLSALITLGQTVNLNKLKDYVFPLLGKGSGKPSSAYMRLLRFFNNFGNNEKFLEAVLSHNYKLLQVKKTKHLVLDGTSWSWGKTKIHYMTLGVLVNNVSIPIYSKQLNKLGTSNQNERKELLEKAIELFDLKGMTLLADREYIGKEWFKLLINNDIKFVIRLRVNTYVEEVNATIGRTYQQILQRCQKKAKAVKKQVKIGDCLLWFVAVPNKKPNATEPVFLFLTSRADPTQAVQEYGLRWKIECMFKHLKTNGFNLEDLNLKDTGKTALMMAIVSNAYILSINEGHKRKDSIRYKQYASSDALQDLRPSTSIFRLGLSFLIRKCISLINFVRFLLSILKSTST